MRKKLYKKLSLIIFAVIFISGVSVFTVNYYVVCSTSSEIYSPQSITENFDCILILGCGIKADGTPSKMLEDRLKTGIFLYENGKAEKIIMSGDHGRKNYDEVNLMKKYAMEKGVPSEDIFMDHAGFSTYESMYRARDIFKARNVIVVTQKYHLFRSLYIAKSLGLHAIGVCADFQAYAGNTSREIREVLARSKDFVKCIFTPPPTYLGDVIPVSGNGNLTND